MLLNRIIASFALFGYLAAGVAAQPILNKNISTPPELSLTERVDKLFTAWNKRETPGGVIAVIRDGKIIYKRGYGMASLEYGIRNNPSTIFHVASISKQFTAFAIHLLAQDGKLALGDDARKYLPELPDFGAKITIRHLLHHTSGLRDDWNLLMLSGWRPDDVTTEQDILRLISRQRTLNFQPGEEELYCNMGYTLLGIIVKRVSGKSLREFTQERIFKPLGMSHTHFQEDYRIPVKNRAYSYYPNKAGGYDYAALSCSYVGPTGLFTTVEDLAKWDQNFYDGRVGGKVLLAEMQKRGTLNNGKEVVYASGLGIREYRGQKTVEHSGADAGYRTHILRFPDLRFSVVIFANVGDANPYALSYRIADIYLEDKLAPVPDSPAPKRKDIPTEIPVSPKVLAAYVGDYEFKPGEQVTITQEGNQLMVQGTGAGRVPLFPYSETEFFLKNSDARLTFVRSPESEQAQTVVLHHKGRDTSAKRLKRIPLTEYTGEFYSEELNVLYTVTLRGDQLILCLPRGEVKMTRTLPDTFEVAASPLGKITYSRGRDTACNGFVIDSGDGRVRNLRFLKAKVIPYPLPN